MGQFTTLEAIDLLRNKEVESLISYCNIDTTEFFAEIRMDSRGNIQRFDEQGKPEGLLQLSGVVLNKKWSPKVNYVSFLEAMKAYERGTTIKSHIEHLDEVEGSGYRNKYLNIEKGVFSLASIRITKGKWTIEDRKN